MRVFATTLCLGISILLAEEIDGWRFVSWSVQRGLDQERIPDPDDATGRRFASAEEALAYFRSRSDAPT